MLTGDAVADAEVLDAWAVKRTGGLVERMPVALSDDTMMVLASALALRTRWLRPFRDVPCSARTGMAERSSACGARPSCWTGSVSRTRPPGTSPG